jgi:hypothetical protein
VCEVCDHIEASAKAVEKLALGLGIRLQEATLPEMPYTCPYCLRVEYRKLGGFNLSERVLLERFHAAIEGGTLFCAPENAMLQDELQAAFDRVARAEWGEHYAALRALTNEQDRTLRSLCVGRTPRRVYLCRVRGCQCLHAKTEEEWYRAMRGRAA